MVAPLLLALIDPVSKLLDRIIPDPEARAKAVLELKKEENAQTLEELRLAVQSDQMQADINLEEAKNSNLFVSGWRSFIGWVCGIAFAYHYILQPLLAFLFAASGHKVDLPVFDMDALVTVLFGMLGLGGLRTFEKVKGVTK